MKQFIIIILVTLTFCSCKESIKNNRVEGEIYIKLIDVRKIISQLPDKDLKKIKQNALEDNQSNLSVSEKKSNEYFKILINNNLLEKPFFKLKLNSGKIINVYTTETNIRKINNLINDLDKENERISVIFEGYKVSNGVFDDDGIFDQPIYVANKIITSEKSKGKTEWKK
ncbi:hypothetical protein [Olleya namhaensis]|uniref:hypothetical protein n=1 Tax=Olleya namhaensis TaxID=1144750 RepID=UPI002493AB39|nr:hypothetical protein [Olleya namhaensis]